MGDGRWETWAWSVDNNHIRRWSALNKRYFIIFSPLCAVCQLPFTGSAPFGPCSLSCSSCLPPAFPAFPHPHVTHLSARFCSLFLLLPPSFFPFIVSVTKRRALYADCSLAQTFRRTRLLLPLRASLFLCFPRVPSLRPPIFQAPPPLDKCV